jgi:hypothetical protein
LATKLKLSLLTLSFLILACGPKPSVYQGKPATPESAWGLFVSRYENIDALALSGGFMIKNDRKYESKLQTFYLSPDSFAFLAEGTLGIDLARGALISGHGFWEVPRDKYHEDIGIGDMIVMGDGEIAIDIDVLLKAIFFFKNLSDYTYETTEGTKYIYQADYDYYRCRLALNKATATPTNLTIFMNRDAGPAEIQIDYYGWKSLGNDLVMPGRIKMDFRREGLQTEYNIGKLKVNPRIPNSYFEPKL